jgi:hypothetical protein
MATQVRRSGVRAPIPDEQYAAGETYYTKDHLRRIFRSFKAKPDTDLDWLRDEIERCAWVYVAFSDHHRPRSIEPSERKRRLNSFRKRAEAFLAAAEAVGANMRLAEDIRGAADALAKRDGLPDFGPELIRYESIPPGDPISMPVWHGAAEKQIKKTHDGLRWFVRVLREAEARAQQGIRPAGNRADLPQHEFVCGIERVYQKTALEPRRPNFDPISEEERGELLDLLNACLLPLGVNMTRSALLGLYRRAIG